MHLDASPAVSNSYATSTEIVHWGKFAPAICGGVIYVYI